MRLVFVLSMCFVLSDSSDAAKLSQFTKRFVERVNAAAQKTVTPVKQGVAVVVCGAMLCAFGLQSAHGLGWNIRDTMVGKLALTGANRENVQSVGGELEFILTELPVMGEWPFYVEDFSDIGYVDTKVVHDGDSWHFPRVRGYLRYAYGFPSPLSYARGGGLNTDWSFLGYEYHDFRTHGFDNQATEGFVVQYLHLMGISNARLWKPGFPVLKSSIGVIGSLLFEQADLTEWAGDGSNFGAWFWHNGSLSWRFLSFWEGLRGYPKEISYPPPVDFGIKVEQLRSILGGVYLDNDSEVDGDFTAIWEAVTADIVWTIFSDNPNRPYKESTVNLVVEGSLYRQRLNGRIDGGKTFSQNEMGKSLEVKIEFKK